MLENRYADMYQHHTWESYHGELARAQTHKTMTASSLDMILKCGLLKCISWELGCIQRFNLKYGQIPSFVHRNAREHTMRTLLARTLKNLKLLLDFQLRMNFLNLKACQKYLTHL